MNPGADHLLRAFERMKQENLDHLEAVTRLQLKMFQVTATGDIDVTNEHCERIVRAIDELDQAITYLKSKG